MTDLLGNERMDGEPQSRQSSVSSSTMSTLTPSEPEEQKEEAKGSGKIAATSESDDEDEDIFDVEQIVSHRMEKGQDMWRVRWVGYGPDDDTWEPRENFLEGKALNMLTEFEAERMAKKEKRKEIHRKSTEYTLKRQELSGEKTKEEEEEVEEEDESLNASWFGIKPDEGSREQRRLFVHDRKLDKTEKLLTEIASSPGVRILRRHLKEQTEKDEHPAIPATPSTKGQTQKRMPRKTPNKKATKAAQSSSSSDIFTTEYAATPQKEEKDGKTLVEVKTKPKEDEMEGPLAEQTAKGIELEQKQHEEKKQDQLEAKAKKSGPSSSRHVELGISRGLKGPKKHRLAVKMKHQQKKARISAEDAHEEKLKKRMKREGEPTKKRTKKLAVIKQEESGLPLPLLVEGSSSMDTVIKSLVRKGKQPDGAQISQEEFEEIVMDGKVDKVRAALSEHVKKPFLEINHQDEMGMTLIHKLSEIKCGVSHTQCELIDLLVSHGARLDIREASNDQLPLHLAIANRRLCHVRKLLDLSSPVNLADKSGKSPVILALECSDTEFMRCLLKAGASFQPALEKLYMERDRNKRQFRMITDHESQLRKALNSARDNVTMNMSVKCISPLFVHPLHECSSVHTFNLSSQPQLPTAGDFAYLLFVAIAEFLQPADERTEKESSCCAVEARMWGQNPVKSVTMNDRIAETLKPGNRFAFLCVPCQGQNKFEVMLDPMARKSRLVVLSQVVLAQMFHRPAAIKK